MSKKKCPEFENHERWLVSYADMLTLLFAVFVVLYALKEGGEPQVQRTAGSMQESFNTPLEDIPLDRRVGPSEHGFGVFEHFKGQQIRPPLVEKFPSDGNNKVLINREMDQVKNQLDMRLYGPHKFVQKDSTGHARIVEVMRTEKGFKLKLMGSYFFEEGETNIKRSALPSLDVAIQIIKELGRNVTVEGHTDSLPPKGELSNWDISALRATHIVRYMIQRHQFPASRLSAAGYGDVKPIAHNGTEEGRSLNRRIEIQIEFDQNSPAAP